MFREFVSTTARRAYVLEKLQERTKGLGKNLQDVGVSLRPAFLIANTGPWEFKIALEAFETALTPEIYIASLNAVESLSHMALKCQAVSSNEPRKGLTNFPPVLALQWQDGYQCPRAQKRTRDWISRASSTTPQRRHKRQSTNVARGQQSLYDNHHISGDSGIGSPQSSGDTDNGQMSDACDSGIDNPQSSGGADNDQFGDVEGLGTGQSIGSAEFDNIRCSATDEKTVAENVQEAQTASAPVITVDAGCFHLNDNTYIPSASFGAQLLMAARNLNMQTTVQCTSQHAPFLSHTNMEGVVPTSGIMQGGHEEVEDLYMFRWDGVDIMDLDFLNTNNGPGGPI
ncbi:hypothetical protein BKA67DRAFT_321476 [Truncatella angustata]|uniref:Uncharacterized protein n=1 Tax=Truncatella angustata TaxID=152316 RepID=A0A9P8UJR0_9PEZI|nr:uncharacterized protein BKA67DRAFT_321476 [Truncatella angustata]KAH6653439.1 hypothetical protein BKA67DRAFT_321476 [Truncatella angustata]